MVQIQQPGIGQKGYAMSNATKVSESLPVDVADGQPTDPEVLQFRENFDARSTLDELVREGARKMLQAAIDAEVDEFVAKHSDRLDENGRRLVVRNGKLPEREILTGEIGRAHV